jgi:hypothetical protein
MARLFVTPREIDFISDITKELVKDVAGQKVYYYRVREEYSNMHDVYLEATEKVFDPPVEIEGLVEWGEVQLKSTNFGVDQTNSVTVYLHFRDLLDKNLVVRTGDYFSYGNSFYEISQAVPMSKVFGQIEHSVGVKLIGQYARKGLVDKLPIGPTSEENTEKDAVQTEFNQQRGFTENAAGPTNDKRQLVANGRLDKPLGGPQSVLPDGVSSSFYGDDK